MYFISIILTIFLTFTGIQATPYQHEAFRHKHHKHHKQPKPQNETVSFKARNVIDAFNAVDHNLLSFNKTLNKLNSAHHLRNPYHLLMMVHSSDKLDDSVKRTIGFCRKADNLTRFESDKVVESLMRMVPHMTSLMDNLAAHKPEFDKAILGVGSISLIVAKKLRQTGSLSEMLGRALTAKLIPEYALLAPGMTAKMTEQYEEVIRIFEQPREESEKSGPEFIMPDVTEITDMLRWKFNELWTRFKNKFKKSGHRLRHGHDEDEVGRYQSIENSTKIDRVDRPGRSTEHHRAKKNTEQ